MSSCVSSIEVDLKIEYPLSCSFSILTTQANHTIDVNHARDRGHKYLDAQVCLQRFGASGSYQSCHISLDSARILPAKVTVVRHAALDVGPKSRLRTKKFERVLFFPLQVFIIFVVHKNEVRMVGVQVG